MQEAIWWLVRHTVRCSIVWCGIILGLFLCWELLWLCLFPQRFYIVWSYRAEFSSLTCDTLMVNMSLYQFEYVPLQRLIEKYHLSFLCYRIMVIGQSVLISSWKRYPNDSQDYFSALNEFLRIRLYPLPAIWWLSHALNKIALDHWHASIVFYVHTFSLRWFLVLVVRATSTLKFI